MLFLFRFFVIYISPIMDGEAATSQQLIDLQ